MSSTRLPGKVLKIINHQPLIKLLINRLSKSKLTDQVVVACTVNSKDDVLADYLKEEGINFFRGEEHNVLKRYYECANQYGADFIIRITADCPFIDPLLVDKCLEKIIEHDYDYVSNTQVRSYPDGLDVATFRYSALEEAYLNCSDSFGLEHVTPHMKKNKKLKKFSVENNIDYSNIRITVDEQADLEVIRSIYEEFKKDNFSWEEIINLYKEKPEIFIKNELIARNEGSTMTNTAKLWKRAKSIIPGGNHLLSKRPEQFAPNIWPAYYSKSAGCEVYDLEEKKYLDLSIMGVGTNILGYCNQEIDDAVIDNLRKGNMSSLNAPEEVYLAEKLLDLNEWADMVRLARTGGEANSVAIRIARAASGKSKVAICGYHGWHDWYLSANLKDSSSLNQHHLEGLDIEGVPKELIGTTLPFAFNNLKELEEVISNNDVGVIKMEVQRNIPPKDDFLQKVRDLANKNNIVLIFDECTSGFRETFGGLYKKYNVEPDIAIYGKALGNGYPITAIVGKKEIMDAAQSTFISSTFWTERSGPTAALKTLEIMEREKSWEYISRLGNYIGEGWKQIAKSNDLDIEVFGLPAINKYRLITNHDFIKYKTFITQEMLKKGFLATNSVYVSMSHTKNTVNKYLSHLDEIFRIIRQCELEKEDIDALLEGEVCHSGFERLN